MIFERISKFWLNMLGLEIFNFEKENKKVVTYYGKYQLRNIVQEFLIELIIL